MFIIKRITVLFAALTCLALAGCTFDIASPAEQTPAVSPSTSPCAAPAEISQPVVTPYPLPIKLADLPEDYPPKEAEANGDYIPTLTKNINEDKMTAFLDAVSKRESAAIRIIIYTDEGDPTIADVIYDGKAFTVWYDTTRDRFAGVNGKKVTRDDFQYLLKYEHNGETFTYLANEPMMTEELFRSGPKLQLKREKTES